MFGLKRLTSASHLGPLFTSAAAATLFIQSKEGKIQSKNDAATLPKNDGAIYERTVLPPKLHSQNVAIGASKERKLLPPELQSENVAMLTCDSSAGGGKCDVYLVGTRHYTPEETKREVEAVIQSLRPEVVFLETCSSRLTPDDEDELKRAGKHVGEVVILAFQGDAGQSEFIAASAYIQAMKCGAKVILGDRPAEITKRRAAAQLSIWHMIKIKCIQLKLLPFSDAKRDFWEQHPYLKEPLVDERDQYMSVKILEAAREHNLVVAVVGQDHLAGIQKYWKQPVELEQLLSVPPPIKNPVRTPVGMGLIIAPALILACRFIKK